MSLKTWLQRTVKAYATIGNEIQIFVLQSNQLVNSLKTHVQAVKQQTEFR